MLALLVVHFVAPQRSGVLAMTQVLEPYVLLSGLVAAAVAAATRVRWRTGVALLLVIAAAGRCAPSLASVPGSAGSGSELRVAAWNMLSANNAAERVLQGVASVEADMIGLEELRIEAARAVESDATLTSRYPHRALVPEQTVLGMGLLSRHPIVEQQAWSDPPLLRALVAPAGEEPVVVFVGHPLPARFQSVTRVPIGLDTTKRDADIAFIRSLVEIDLAIGRDVLVIGDFNVTEREPAYMQLAAGMRDAHLDAGLGPGLTWRPPALRWLPGGLLRIDYILSSADLEPLEAHVDCSAPSDHCIVLAHLSRRPSPA